MQLEHSRRLAPVLFHGHSMRPFLEDGDELAAEPVGWEAIRVGDIVTYRQADKFPTRRVVEKREDRLVLVGDNWPRARFEATRADVLARVVQRRRGRATVSPEDWRWRSRARVMVWRYRLRRLAAALLRRPVRRLRDGLAGCGLGWGRGAPDGP